MNIRLFILGLIWGSCFFMIAEVSADNVKIEKNPENCKKVKNYGSNDELMIAKDFKVPVNSLRFLGANWQWFSPRNGKDDYECVLTFDSTKGPIECKVTQQYLYTDDGGVTAWIPLIVKDRYGKFILCEN